jgi:ubiquinone/menaquinone biosynthesis C-methylase UbiE
MKISYIKHYKSSIKKINFPQNIITRIFLSKFSPLKKNFKNKKILDYSCGSGPYLNFLKLLNFDIYASEISLQITSRLNKRINGVKFIISNNKKIDLPKNYINYFFSIHSIYYLQNKNESLELVFNEILRVLKKDGYLICTFLKKKQSYLKFLKEKKNLYKIIFDKYKIRQGSYIHLFENKNQIIKYFSKKFKIIEIGEYKSNFNNLDENYFICIFKKK